MQTGDQQAGEANPNSTNRVSLLLTMYGEMWDNINRHVTVVWQGIAVLFTVVGAALLRTANIISPDVATSLVVLVSFWMIAHTLDASAWCNRNLLIIANIEREFLYESDKNRIHPYFAMPAKRGMLEHLKIQGVLSSMVAGVALAEHFYSRVRPGIYGDSSFDPPRVLPYAVALGATIFLLRLNKHFRKQYGKLVSSTRPDSSGSQTTPSPVRGTQRPTPGRDYPAL